jgi:TolA-binding protein
MSGTHIKNNSVLKQLHSQASKIEGDIESLDMERNRINKEMVNKREQLKEIKAKITSIHEHNKDLLVSEHAIIRYLERVEGFNFHEIRHKIITEKLKEQFKVLGNGTYPIDGKFSVKIQNNVIVTIFI